MKLVCIEVEDNFTEEQLTDMEKGKHVGVFGKVRNVFMCDEDQYANFIQKFIDSYEDEIND